MSNPIYYVISDGGLTLEVSDTASNAAMSVAIDLTHRARMSWECADGSQIVPDDFLDSMFVRPATWEDLSHVRMMGGRIPKDGKIINTKHRPLNFFDHYFGEDPD